jgi:hypothetical protein
MAYSAMNAIIGLIHASQIVNGKVYTISSWSYQGSAN